MKENFGFIERADVVKEIFFHFSEAKTLKDELKLGDDVEFIIQTRNVSLIIITKRCKKIRGKFFCFTLENNCIFFRIKK